jgi:hypothetical protein
MYNVRYGGKTGKRISLTTSNEHIVVRTSSRNALAVERPFEATPISLEARSVLSNFELTHRFNDAGVEILQAKVARGAKGLRDRARAILKKEPEIDFAGRVLVEPTPGRPVIYTENVFVKFVGEQSATACKRIIKQHGLTVKRELEYAPNAYFVAAPEDTGLKIFDITTALLEEPGVELCHPELIREIRRRGAFPPQWHLKKTTIGGQVVDQADERVGP